MKKRLLCPQLPRKGIPTLLGEMEAHHAVKVLRLRDGEIVEALDGKGHRIDAILRVKGGTPRLEFIEGSVNLESLPEQGPEITLEMSVLKGDAMEWVVEKAVELGVKKLIPVLTDFTVVQMKNKTPQQFQERWQKIADQALKQCGRLNQLEVSEPIALEKLISQPGEPSATRIWCDESGISEAPYIASWVQAATTKNIHLLIGPEGGWSPNEKTLLRSAASRIPIERIHLGPRILRAETAALFTVSFVYGSLFEAKGTHQ